MVVKSDHSDYDYSDEKLDRAIEAVFNKLGLNEGYIYHFCRHLDGISFEQTMPTIIGPISLRQYVSSVEWANQSSVAPVVKITLPGPMTILNSLVNNYYQEIKMASRDLSRALRAEILNLIELGCRHIQLNEPVITQKPDLALAYGLQHVEFILRNLPEDVERTLQVRLNENEDELRIETGSGQGSEAYRKLTKRLKNLKIPIVN